MKQPYVKSGYTIILLPLLAVLSFQYFLHWSLDAKKSWANVTNTELIQLGMNAKQVVDIMGAPDQINKLDNNSQEFEYYYSPPFLASDGILLLWTKTV